MNQALTNLLDPISHVLYKIPAIILAFTIHEFMHAYVAVKAGDETPINQGRYTLNPIKHIDPIGFIMVLFAGIGWAKPVQVNINNFKNGRKDFLMVSFAGVLGNFMLAFAAAAVMFFSSGFLAKNEIIYYIVYYIVYINLMLICINILPIPPLDGFNILTTLVRFKNMNIIYNIKRYGFFILIILWFTGILRFYIQGLVSLLLNGFFALFNLIQSLAGML